MATIKRQVVLDKHPDEVWKELADFSAAGRLFAGALTGCETRGDRRTITLANGLRIDQRLVTLDPHERRLVYTNLNGFFTHHIASMQILPKGNGCTFVWISDFLPNEVAEKFAPLVDASCAAFQRSFGAD